MRLMTGGLIAGLTVSSFTPIGASASDDFNAHLAKNRAEYYEGLLTEAAKNPKFCIVSVQCELVQDHDSLYQTEGVSFSDSVKQSIERRKQIKKSEVMNVLEEAESIILDLDEVSAEDKKTISACIRQLDKNYADGGNDIDASLNEDINARRDSEGDDLVDAVHALPERVRTHVNFKTGSADGKISNSVTPNDYGNSVGGGRPMTKLGLTTVYLKKFSDIYRGLLQCAADLREIENIPSCDEIN